MNVYNLGYTEVLLAGELKNLLNPVCYSFLTLFATEIHTYLRISELRQLPIKLLTKPLKGIRFESSDNITLGYFKNTYSTISFTKEVL